MVVFQSPRGGREGTPRAKGVGVCPGAAGRGGSLDISMTFRLFKENRGHSQHFFQTELGCLGCSQQVSARSIHNEGRNILS